MSLVKAVKDNLAFTAVAKFDRTTFIYFKGHSSHFLVLLTRGKPRTECFCHLAFVWKIQRITINWSVLPLL